MYIGILSYSFTNIFNNLMQCHILSNRAWNAGFDYLFSYPDLVMITRMKYSGPPGYGTTDWGCSDGKTREYVLLTARK